MDVPLPALDRRRGRVLGVLAGALVLCLGTGATADAATARLKWLPVASASSYKVYVRNAGNTYGPSSPTSPPTLGSDGLLSATVTYTPATTNNYFAVSAIVTSTEGNISGELPIGPTNPCTIDHCSARLTCQFGNYSDGTACDDQSFCNGHESCVSGQCSAGPATDCADAIACTADACDESQQRCTHQGPPGCCVACESGDPCLADACAAGNCQAELGTELEVQRVRLMHKAAGIKLAAKAMFIPDGPTNPTASGATVEMLTPDGMVLFSSVIAGSSFRAGDKGRYRFAASRVESQYLSNGITRLDVRVKHEGEWHVTLKAETPALEDAFLESSLTWMIRFGDTCVRRRDMTCELGEKLSLCY